MLFYVTARLRAVFALRAEFSSLSFPKEKGTKKKSDLRACALKNPPHCTELLRSIKNGMFVVAAITGRTSSPLRARNCTKQEEETKSLHRYNVEHTRAFPSRGRCHEVTDEVRPCGSMGVCAVTAFSDMTSDALSTALYKISPYQNLSSQLRLLRRRHLIRHGFAATPSPRGEGLVADQNLMST